jgi:hypothetical protein
VPHPSLFSSSVSLQPFFFLLLRDHLHISSSYSGLTVFSFSVHRALLGRSSLLLLLLLMVML